MELVKQPKKSYYAVIPADVRYNKSLPMGARMLYGELTALANEKGYCWATNNYFAELYDVSISTISSWIAKLEQQNYIHREIIYKNGSREVDERRIYIVPINDNVTEASDGTKNNWDSSQTNLGEGIPKNWNTPPPKNLKDNNTVSNNTLNTTEDIYIVDRASETEEENFLEEKPISKGKDAVPYKEIVSLYHELCPSLPRVAQLTDTRKRKLKVLWNFVEGNLDKIKEVFEKAEESQFLSGRNAKWTGCNFDWLINTNNFVKVLEGSYNDRRSTGETHRRDEDDPFGIKAYLSQWGDDLSMYER
jgi:hypothetical protein